MLQWLPCEKMRGYGSSKTVSETHRPTYCFSHQAIVTMLKRGGQKYRPFVSVSVLFFGKGKCYSFPAFHVQPKFCFSTCKAVCWPRSTFCLGLAEWAWLNIWLRKANFIGLDSPFLQRTERGFFKSLCVWERGRESKVCPLLSWNYIATITVTRTLWRETDITITIAIIYCEGWKRVIIKM